LLLYFHETQLINRIPNDMAIFLPKTKTHTGTRIGLGNVQFWVKPIIQTVSAQLHPVALQS